MLLAISKLIIKTQLSKETKVLSNNNKIGLAIVKFHMYLYTLDQ